MICAACGGELQTSSSFCPGCGRPAEAAPVFCTSCGSKMPADSAFCSSCGHSMGAVSAASSSVRLSFAGTAGQAFLFLLSLFVLPAWLVAALWVVVARWICRSLRFRDGTTASFRGTEEEVLGWAVLSILLACAALPFPPLAVVLIFPQAAVGLQIMKWFWSHVELSGRPPLRFVGRYGGYLGWSLLVLVSVFTIIGWAWAVTALYRWIFANVQGGGLRFRWEGKGHEVLWRFLVGGLACLLIIPIPWIALWLLRWVIEQTAIERTAAASATA